MKIIRWAATAALILISLMDIGTFSGTGDERVPTAVIVLSMILGVVGLVAAVGLFRRLQWGRSAGVLVTGINVIAAITSLAVGTGGAAIGLVVSGVAMTLCFLAADTPFARTRVATTS
jgi:uncharacterized membrane protein (DUF2068 family)